MCHHHKRPSHDPCTAKPRNSPTNDEHHRIRCNTTDETPQLKSRHGTEEGPFGIEEGEYPSVGRLESTGGDEVGTAIPANIGIGVELIGDARNGLRGTSVSAGTKMILSYRGDNCPVE